MGNAAPFVKKLHPVKVISLTDFKKYGSFPRNPSCEKMCVPVTEVDRATSLIIYVSHLWLRSYHGCEDWEGRPHPDRKDKKMYKLCLSAISKIFKNMAPGMTHCYLWVDYCCLNQGEFI